MRAIQTLRVPAALAALLLTPAPAPAADDIWRLGHQVEPTSQVIRMTLDADKPDYSGTITVALKVREKTSMFRFHAREMTLDKLTLTGPVNAAPLKTEKPRPDLAEVTTAKPLTPGDYTLTIEFHNQFNTRAVALYRVQTGGHSYLFTQFEATEAREAFPCWDEPEFKFPYQLIVTAPAKHLVLSNTPIERETAVAAGMKRVTFERTPPLPSYLVAVASGPLETVAIPGMSIPGRVVTVQGASALAAEAVRLTPPLLKALEGYFGRPYPFEKLDLVAAPEFLYGAMENPGAIVFADRRLLLDPHAAGEENRRALASVIAHELAHMWFGDLVTMRWWDDLWLNESFASWMGTRAMDRAFPDYHSGITEAAGTQRAMVMDARLSTHAMRQQVLAAGNLEQTADELAYNKGQAVLDMFEGWLGPETFRAGVIEYLKDHEWGNATGSDLWHALSKASGQDIDAAMSSFLDQPGVPLVTLESLDGEHVRLSQRRFLNYGVAPSTPERWRIPVALKFGDGTTTHTKQVWLTDSTLIVDLGIGHAAAWIYPNAGASGYYRWQIPAETLTGLAERGATALSTRERLGYVQNLTAMLHAGTLHGEDYLHLLRIFSNDPDPEVVGALITALGEVRVSLVPEDAQAGYEAFVRSTLAPALERFGRARVDGEPPSVTLMRPRLLQRLGDEGRDPDVLRYAESVAEAYRKDPASVDPTLAEAAVTLAAIRGDRTLFDEYRRRFETAKVPSERALYLGALGGFRDPALIEEALRYVLSGPIRPQETVFVPNALATHPPNQDKVFRWITENYAAVAARVPRHFTLRLIRLAGGCSNERVESARAFFMDPARYFPGTEIELARVGDAVRDCAGLREREGSRVASYLRGFAAVN